MIMASLTSSQVLLNYMDQMEESGFNIYEVNIILYIAESFQNGTGTIDDTSRHFLTRPLTHSPREKKTTAAFKRHRTSDIQVDAW